MGLVTLMVCDKIFWSGSWIGVVTHTLEADICDVQTLTLILHCWHWHITLILGLSLVTKLGYHHCAINVDIRWMIWRIYSLLLIARLLIENDPRLINICISVRKYQTPGCQLNQWSEGKKWITSDQQQLPSPGWVLPDNGSFTVGRWKGLISRKLRLWRRRGANFVSLEKDQKKPILCLRKRLKETNFLSL
jgi:hypothetical protein